MISRTYVAVPGGGITDKDAAVVGPELERVFGDRPRTAEEVVRAARPKRSLLHPHFEWNDTAAAEEYRREQARWLLRHIAVVESNGEERPPTRAFHAVTVEGLSGRAYVPAQVVWSSPDFSGQIVAKAHRELVAWAARHREYQVLAAHHIAAVERVAEEILAA